MHRDHLLVKLNSLRVESQRSYRLSFISQRYNMRRTYYSSPVCTRSESLVVFSIIQVKVYMSIIYMQTLRQARAQIDIVYLKNLHRISLVYCAFSITCRWLWRNISITITHNQCFLKLFSELWHCVYHHCESLRCVTDVEHEIGRYISNFTINKF